MPKQPALIALIPARAGSKRLHDKNIQPLSGHPLMAYTITAALQSQVFATVIVSTDSEQYADIARHYGAEVPFLRPPEFQPINTEYFFAIANATRNIFLSSSSMIG